MNQNQRESFLAFLKDLFPGEFSQSPGDEELERLKSKTIEAIRLLDPTERDIVNCLYGFGDDYVYKPQEVRKIFKMSTEVVEQNRKSSLRKIATLLDVIHTRCF